MNTKFTFSIKTIQIFVCFIVGLFLICFCTSKVKASRKKAPQKKDDDYSSEDEVFPPPYQDSFDHNPSSGRDSAHGII